jgi:hypothetical protein
MTHPEIRIPRDVLRVIEPSRFTFEAFSQVSCVTSRLKPNFSRTLAGVFANEFNTPLQPLQKES